MTTNQEANGRMCFKAPAGCTLTVTLSTDNNTQFRSNNNNTTRDVLFVIDDLYEYNISTDAAAREWYSGHTGNETFTSTNSGGWITIFFVNNYYGGNNPNNRKSKFRVTISCNCSSPCDNATNLPCGTTDLAGTTVGTANVNHGTGYDISNYGVWYTFTGNGNQTTISSTGGYGFDQKMVIVSGSCGNFTQVTQQDSYGAGWTETYTFTAQNGVNYYVYIAYWDEDGTSNETGTFTISRTCVTPPSNSTCATATNIPCGTTDLAGTTVGTPGTAHGIPGADVSNYGVWYTFVGDGNQTTISTTGGSGFDQEMVIARGSCNNLTFIDNVDGSGNGGTESYTFTAQNGVTYYVYVAYYDRDGDSYDVGNFTISRTCVTPPSNSTCATATNLPCGTSNLEGTTVGTPGTAHGIPNADVSNYGVWYTFVGDGNRTTITSTAESGFDHEMDICSGSCNNLTLIADLDAGSDGGTESYTFQTTNGVTYYVYIAHYSDYYNTTGSFNISRTCVEPLCPPSDMCELTFELTDSYGDGWNGASIQVVDVQSGSILGELTMDNDSYVSGSLEVCNGREIRFVWNSGSYDYECSYTVYDVNGGLIFSGTEGSSLPYTYTPSCTVCPQPTNVTVTDITNSTATVSWSGSADSYNIRWYELVDQTNVTLTAGDVWGDGTGYQMLLDANANTYGTTIPTTGGLTTDGDASAATYAEFEYKIPEDADGSLTTTNIVFNTSITITVPAGTYDWCITNPTPGDRMWIASGEGNIGGRADDFVIEAGFNYEFVVTFNAVTGNDQTNLTISPISTVHTANGVTGSQYTMTGLTAGTTYIVQVQANCGGSLSPWTDPENFTTCNLEATIEFGD